MITKTVVALSIAALAATASATAQENATFTMRSGERVSGQLMDLGGVGFTVRINGQERQVPTNDIAVIDFTGGGGSQADWDRLSNGQFVVLKDGQTLTGQLTDVGGSAPLRLSFRINGADRDFPSSDVARIVLARPIDAPTGTTPPLTGGGTSPQGIMVPAQQAWTPTGLTLRRGETVTLNATGEIRFPGTASPSGSGERNEGNPIPGASTGTLIGRIGNGQPFVIGSQTQFRAPAAGQLFLGINDSHHGDNSGSFQVQLQRANVRTR